ncbi:MAG: porin family protein [Bacteroidetes bacterium]|nr:porin family protein [Bacteroidota bacterium]
MKKFSLLLAILIFTAGATFGQFNFGLKIGYNASKLSTSLDSITSSFNSGMHFGAFFRFGLGKKIYIQPEAYYTLQGGLFKNDAANTLNNWEQKVTVGTLDIPVLIGFKLINAKIVNWRIMAGPMVSFVVNSKIKNVSLTGPITSSDITKLNWYMQVGTGVDLWFLTLDIRYQVGLNHMINSAQYEDSNGNPTGTEYLLNAKNNMWVVSLGFKI